jgi:hypothetical protein
MFHGTVYSNHASILRHGLRPAPHGGPYVTPDREEAIGYAIAATQEHQVLTGDRDARGIVYRLQIPEDKIKPASVEGDHKLTGEFCVPGGVSRAWFVGAELGSVPTDASFSAEFAAAGRAWWRELDTAAQLRRRARLPSMAELAILMGEGDELRDGETQTSDLPGDQTIPEVPQI